MKKLILGLFVSAMMACNQPQGTSLKMVKVDVNSADYLKEEAVFKDFDFVKLDTVSEALLSDVSKVLVGEDRIYVLPVMDARVFIFDEEGKYLNSLRKGQGPGEVRCVYDMKLHEGCLYVFDNFRIVRKYDKDGGYIGDVYTSSGYNLLMDFERDQLLLFDPYMNPGQGKLMTIVTRDSVSYHFPKHQNHESPFFFNSFYHEGYVSWPMCDTIYRYDAEKMMAAPEYVVQFAHPSVYDVLEDETIDIERWNEIVKDDYFCKWLHYPVISNDQLFFSFRYDKLYYVKYKEGKSNIYSTLIEGLPTLDVGAKGRSGNRMIYSYSMLKLMEYKKKMGKMPADKLRELYNQVTNEEDNPILVFAALE